MSTLFSEFFKSTTKLLNNLLYLSIILFISSFFISYQPIFSLIKFHPINPTILTSALSVYGMFLGIFFCVLLIAAFFHDHSWTPGNNLVFDLRDLFERFWLIGSTFLFLSPCLIVESPQKIIQIYLYSRDINFGLAALIFFSILQLGLFFVQLLGFDLDSKNSLSS